MKRVLTAVLIMMMVPLFMGLFCPCAAASVPVDGPSFTKAPCHGCCPEIAAAPQDVADQVQSFFTVPFVSKIFNTLKALSSGASRDIAINRRAYVPAGDEPSFLSSQHPPLYLVLQVFRI